MKTFDEIVELCDTEYISESKRTLINCWIEKYYVMMKSKVIMVEAQNIYNRAIKNNIEINEYILKRYEVEYGYNLRSLELLEKQIFQ
jgi:hypothetical protein